MEQIWFDGTPAEALAALGVRGHTGPEDAEQVRSAFAADRKFPDRPGRETLRVAAIAVGDRTRVYWPPDPDLPDGTYLCGFVAAPARVAAITGWLDTAWAATTAVHVVHEDRAAQAAPAGPTVLAVVTDPAELAEVRRETTTGVFLGDDCRCGPELALHLHDAAGRLLGAGEVHAHGSVNWERSRFHNPVRLDDRTAMVVRMIGWGVPGQLRPCYFQLVDALRTERAAYWAEHTPPSAGADLGTVLDWLGCLEVPREALHGAGVEIRRLLDAYPAGAVIAAAATDPSPLRLLGAMNWAIHQPDDVPMARVLAPAIRRLL